MGGIVLGLLRGIGSFFLILIAVMLCILLIVLFDPITYRVRSEKSPEVLFCRVKINWLFGLIRFQLRFEEKLQIKLCVLWFDLLKKKSIGKTNRNQEEAVTASDVPSEDCAEESKSVKEEVSSDPDDTAQGAGDVSSDLTKETDYGETDSSEKKKKSFFQKVKSFPETIRGIRDKIMDIRNNISEYKKLLEHPNTKLLWQKGKPALLRILYAVCPTRCEGRVLYGTGSPDTTGYLYGVYGLLSPKLGEHFCVEPDFQQAILEGEIRIRGRVFLITLLINGLAILCRKELRILIRQMKSIQSKNRR